MYFENFRNLYNERDGEYDEKGTAGEGRSSAGGVMPFF